MMMVVVTSVSLMVHISPSATWPTIPATFFSYISLFTFSMLMLVMSNNMVQLSSAGKRWAWCRTC